MLSWSESPYSSFALFTIAFAEASIFPLPPDILLIALILGNKNKSLRYTLLCTISSVMGGVAGYVIGHYFWWNGESYNMIAMFFFNNISGFSESLFLSIKEQYAKFGFIIIFIASFTPVPYKIITISAGAFDISFKLFIIASLIGRFSRFFLLYLLLYKYGERIKYSIDNNFNLLTILLMLLLIGGYVFIKYLF